MKNVTKIVVVILTFALLGAAGCKACRRGPAPTGVKSVDVTFISPKGNVYRPQSIVASFSAPMVPISTIGKLEKNGPMTIEPSIPGSFHWLGTNTVSFVPEKPFPFATKFSVKIDDNVLDIKGNGLTTPTSWEFETARPEIINSIPSEGETGAELDQNILIRFNQPMDPSVVNDHLKIVATRPEGNSETIATDARRPTEKELKIDPEDLERAVLVHPKGKLPMASTIELTIDDGLLGAEGSLPTGRAQMIRFTTYDKIKVVSLSCDKKCDPSAPISIELNNDVIPKDVMKFISITPAVEIKNDAVWHTSYLELYGEFAPNTKYEISFAPEFTDVHGTKLDEKKTIAYSTGNYEPSLGLVTGNGVLESQGPKKIAVTTTNVNSLKVRYQPLDKDEIVSSLSEESLFDPYSQATFESTVEKEIRLAAKPNRIVTSPVSLEDGLEGAPTGVLLVDVQSPEIFTLDEKEQKEPTHFTSLIQVTDIGITAKWYDGGALIWTTSLATGAPLPQTAVEIRNGKNNVLWSGTTDSLGISKARFEANSKESSESLYVIAQKEDDVAFSASDWSQGFSPWDFNFWNAMSDNKMKGYLFTERGIYKPGETVHLKGIVRNADDKGVSIPKDLKGKITASDSRGKEFFSKDVAFTDFGSVSSDIEIPPHAPTGMTLLTLDIPQGEGKASRSFRTSVSIAEYKPAEFKVEMKPASKDVVAGDKARVDVDANYLFGEPLKGGSLTYSVFRTRGYFSPKEFEDYTFGTIDFEEEGEEADNAHFGMMEIEGSNRLTLDDKGKAQITIPSKSGSISNTTSYSVEATVADVNKTTISNRTYITFHPGKFYIGLKTASFLATAGTPFELSVIGVGIDDKPDTGKSVTAKLFKREWHAVKKKEVTGYTYDSEPVDTEVGSCDVKTGSEPAKCMLTAKSSGMHFIRATSSDSSGNPVKSEEWLYVSGAGEAAWKPESTDRIDLVADKKSYAPGETAKILIKSPFDKANALITVERDGIIKQESRVLEGYAPEIALPITDKHIPNFYVSVVMVKGRVSTPKEWGADEGRPRVKVGYINIPVSADSKKLNVAVSADKQTYAPGDEVTVTINLKDAAGKPTVGELAIMAVDAGSLMLTNFATPNPFSTFYDEASLNVMTTDSRIHLIGRRSYGVKGEPAGGGGGEELGRMRTKFLTVAYWNPTVVTDANGAATVKFKLPDNLTTFRIMAVASTADMFGGADAEIVTKKPFIVRPALPHFAGLGDMLSIGVIVHNYTDKTLSGTLTTKAQGIELKDDAEKKFKVDAQGKQEIFFDLQASKIGKATLSFMGTADGVSDGVELPLDVRLTRPIEVFTSYGETDSTGSELVDKLSEVYEDIGGLDITLSSTALTGLAEASLYLIKYPYECLEQKLSRGFGAMTYIAIANEYDIKNEKLEDYKNKIKDIISDVASYQDWDGGFRLWPGMRSDVYLTAYATLFMTQAKSFGYEIDQSVYANAKKRLHDILRMKPAQLSMNEDWLRDIKSYILYVLAKAGEPDNAYAETIYNDRAKLSPASRAQLVLAMAYAGGFESRYEDFIQYANNNMSVTAAEAHFETPEGLVYRGFTSDTYTDAYIMSALAKISPNHPMVPKMARYLLGSAKKGFWTSTHSTAAVLTALYDYIKSHESKAPDFKAVVKLGEKEILSAKFEGRSGKTEAANVPIKELTALSKPTDLTFTKSGGGLLYYTTRLTYAPTETPLPPREEGFTIFKTVEQFDKDKKDKEFSRGDTVKIHLEFVLPATRRYVAIEDGLPAGLEAVNFSLKTAEQHLGMDLKTGISIDNVEFYGDKVVVFSDEMQAGSYTFDYVAKAATKGKFSLPPAHIEEMYNPEVFGRTMTGSIEIK